MKPIIVYPLAMDAWEEFERFLYRFTYTFKEYPPGCDYELWCVCNWGAPDEEIRRRFRGTKTRFIEYYGHGCDIGSAQLVGICHDEGDFIIAMTSRCYFHRPGWLARMMEAREKHGPGIYGPFASWESGKPHICTRAYGMDARLWRSYPHQIDTRPKGQFFEVGEGCITTWVRAQGLPAVQVLWDNEQLMQDWRKWPGVFRSGNQNACLLWDKHTDAYRDSPAEDKARLEAMSNIPSYSQHGEDRWIIENMDVPAQAFFCEVGAHDGITGSNTLLFERMGWIGHCIEPDPTTAGQCRKNRKSVLECAAGTGKGKTPFYVNQQDHGLSGLKRPGTEIQVSQWPLSELVCMEEEPWLLSIDTEGTELEVWASRGKLKPKVVIVEYQTCNEPSAWDKILAQMSQDGYSLAHSTEHNMIFTRTN